MVTTITEDMFTAEAIADPYSYFGQLREEDPVHWKERQFSGAGPKIAP